MRRQPISTIRLRIVKAIASLTGGGEVVHSIDQGWRKSDAAFLHIYHFERIKFLYVLEGAVEIQAPHPLWPTR